MKPIKKQLLSYSVVYMCCNLVSNIMTQNRSYQTNIITSNIIRILLFISISLIQLLNSILFQKSYTNTKVETINYTDILEIILQTLRIYVIQFLIILPFFIILGVILLIPINLFQLKTDQSLIIILLTIFPGIIIWWCRLLFIPMIMVYKRKIYKMKEIISESKDIIKTNKSIVIPILCVQYIPMIISTVYTIFKFNMPYSSILYIIVIVISNYLFSLIFIQLIVERTEKLENVKKIQLTTAST
jgi:hypothetical protein